MMLLAVNDRQAELVVGSLLLSRSTAQVAVGAFGKLLDQLLDLPCSCLEKLNS